MNFNTITVSEYMEWVKTLDDGDLEKGMLRLKKMHDIVSRELVARRASFLASGGGDETASGIPFNEDGVYLGDGVYISPESCWF